jgi:hypothetical protein
LLQMQPMELSIQIFPRLESGSCDTRIIERY